MVGLGQEWFNFDLVPLDTKNFTYAFLRQSVAAGCQKRDTKKQKSPPDGQHGDSRVLGATVVFGGGLDFSIYKHSERKDSPPPRLS